jgi:RNA polymerase sigma factor (sigma-70 family)
MSAQELDILLLERFRQKGDEEAFSQIVQRYAGVVFGTCRRILRNSALAEDVTQETFFRLVQRREQVSESLGGWLHRVATSLAIDAARSESSRRKRERACAAQEQVAALDWADVSPKIDEALADLPPQTRALLIDRFLRGRTQTELAAERGLSQATLSRQVKCGVEQLRQILQNKGLVVGAVSLTFWMTDQAVASSAPAAVMQELDKMTMVSGAGGPFAATASALSRCANTIKASAAAIMPSKDAIAIAAVMLLACALAWMMFDLAAAYKRWTAPAVPRHEREERMQNASRWPAVGGFVLVDGDATANSKTVVAFVPPRLTDASVQVMFGDRRVADLPRSEAEQLITRQTRRPMADWIQQQQQQQGPVSSLDSSP